MAGEFCQKRDARGYRCAMADGHAPWPCDFVPVRATYDAVPTASIGKPLATPVILATQDRGAHSYKAVYDASTDPVPRLEPRHSTAIDGTPSTLLGEAFDLLARVRVIMQGLKHHDIDARLMHEQETIGSLYHVSLRDHDAREPKP